MQGLVVTVSVPALTPAKFQPVKPLLSSCSCFWWYEQGIFSLDFGEF